MHRFPLCVLIAGLMNATTAHAEPPGHDADQDRYEYHFDDDPLHGLDDNPYGQWLKVRKKAPRVTLIRPRASFVMELLESIGRL